MAKDWEDIPKPIRDLFMELYDGQADRWFEDCVKVYNQIKHGNN